MSKKTKVLKYKVVNTNIDKKFIGKNLDLEKVKAKGGRVGPTTKKQKSTRDLLIEFMGEQREFNTRIEKDIANLKSDFSILKNDVSSLKKTQDQQNKHLQRIDSRLDRQDERFENIEHELSI